MRIQSSNPYPVCEPDTPSPQLISGTSEWPVCHEARPTNYERRLETVEDILEPAIKVADVAGHIADGASLAGSSYARRVAPFLHAIEGGLRRTLDFVRGLKRRHQEEVDTLCGPKPLRQDSGQAPGSRTGAVASGRSPAQRRRGWR